ncbi:hypothetical protein, partial [Phascolarctobacterium sp.]|uniref:hypothetical protein n=1 Tax=Phascolarctobacterium sp. TaxID=2049039 RepID=UPI0025D874A8
MTLYNNSVRHGNKLEIDAYMLRFEVLRWNLKNWFAKTAAAVILVIRTIYTPADIAEQNMFLQMMETILSITIILISMIRCII